MMKIYLRDATLDDSQLIVKWHNSPKIINHSFNKTPISVESNRIFFHDNVETGNYRQFIVERIDDDFSVVSYPIATVYLKDIDNINKRCELCIFTSDDQEWNSESQRIAVKMLLDKAFFEYGMRKVYSYVFSEFIDEAEMLKKSGFRVEAILRDEAKDSAGEYANVIRFCVFNKDDK